MGNPVELVGRPAATPEDAELVRTIRNQVRSYMTRHTSPIGPEEQLRWWEQIDRATTSLFVFHATGTEDSIGWSMPAGYGLNRLIGGRWWLSGALANQWQGKGLGATLFRCLMADVKALGACECWLEVREDNMRAFNTYRKLGFVEQSRDSGIVTMRATL